MFNVSIAAFARPAAAERIKPTGLRVNPQSTDAR
jgi:hypothetical protein